MQIGVLMKIFLTYSFTSRSKHSSEELVQEGRSYLLAELMGSKPANRGGTTVLGGEQMDAFRGLCSRDFRLITRGGVSV